MIELLLTVMLLFPIQEEWELKKDKNGIQVYTKGSENVTIKSFRGVTVLDASAEQILAVIQDLENYPRWLDRCEYGEILEKVSSETYYIHTKMAMPFPVKNRDVVQFIEVIKSENNILIYIKSTPNFIKEEEDYVRIPFSDGKWSLTPTDSGATKVEIISTSDPGGSIPDWVVNMMIVSTPFNMLENLQEYVKSQD
jgi:ribosome-associated toxin RatA of RatAB toxin-antitoxin module